MNRKARAAIVGGAALALAASGCSSNTGSDGDTDEHAAASTDIIGTAEDSVGPAPAIDGAEPGGAVTMLGDADYTHLDPQRAYVSSYMMTGGGLIWRNLTGYKEEDGEMLLVGDLATDPGTDVNDDCQTWEYTLKDDLKYEDGSEITGEHVGHGVARSFAPEMPDGPQFLQQWLDPDGDYEGPYDDDPLPPGVTVDGNTVTFDFDQPRCEVPFVVAMGTASPVPESEDTGTDYEDHPFSSGPYKIDDRTAGESMDLVRNEHWDPDSDPIRLAYPDEFHFEFTHDLEQISQRLEADAGGDENLASYTPVQPSLLPDVTGNLDEYEEEGRIVHGAQKYNGYLAINNNRVEDIDIRRALNHAIPRDEWAVLHGGEYSAVESTTFLVPVVPGHNEYDAYPQDMEAAEELLEGKDEEDLQLRYAYRQNSEPHQQSAEAFQETLGEIGIDLEIVSIDQEGWYDQIGESDNEYDMYWAGWGHDWPSGSSVIPPTLGEDGMADSGGTNYSFFSEPEIEEEIDRLQALPPEESLEGWGELEQQIMEDHAPFIPLDYAYGVWLTGSNVGGAYLSNNVSTLDVTKLYVHDHDM